MLRTTLGALVFVGAIANAQVPAASTLASIPSADEQVTQAVLPLPSVSRSDCAP